MKISIKNVCLATALFIVLASLFAVVLKLNQPAAIPHPEQAVTEQNIAHQGKRSIVISLDNHIFETQEFYFDEQVLRQNIRAMLEYVRPVRVMAFAVGHDGHAQYPSKFFPNRKPSAQYPKLRQTDQDLLQIWKDETRKTNTQFFIYISTLKNNALMDLKPDYYRKFMNGAQATVIDHNTPFIDKILLPGLQELIDRYDPDGFFLDGDYWTIHESWNKYSVDGFSKTYSVPAPIDYGDAKYKLFQQYTYDSYRLGYVQKLADFFRIQKRPLKWTINASFTFRDPSPVPQNIGSITIDLPFFALVEAHIESLFGQRLNKETEIVYPLFAQSEGAYAYQYKSPVQLKQEMAVAVANGSLIHFYLPLGPTGEISLAKLKPAIDVYDEMDAHFHLRPLDHKDAIDTNLALVNNNADAVLTRDFSIIRAVSIDLFEKGIVHSIITDSLAKQNSFSHLIFPGMNHVADKTLISSLLKQGKKVLWIFDPQRADSYTLKFLKDLDSLNDIQMNQLDICPPQSAFRPAALTNQTQQTCISYKNNKSGGILWVFSESSYPHSPQKNGDHRPKVSDVIESFLSDMETDVRFVDKHDYVYALVFKDRQNLQKRTIFLSSVASGGYAIGRHTLFDHLDVVPKMGIKFDSKRRCVQHSLNGLQEFAPSEMVFLESFDTVTKVVCE